MNDGVTHEEAAPASIASYAAGKTPQLLVLGSINLDVVLHCDRAPVGGETVSSTSMSEHLGGKGANQAVAASRMGAQVRMIGCVGEDAQGESAIQRLRSEGVFTGGIQVAQGATGTAFIVVESDGQNRIVLNAGANALLATAWLHRMAYLLAGAQGLVCQLEVPIPTIRAALQLARSVGVPSILNPAPAVPLPPDLLRLVDILVPNELEAQALAAGLPAADETQLAVSPGLPAVPESRAARLLHAAGVGIVVVTLGARGALVVDKRGMRHVPAEAVQAVDTSGAGDTFIGTLAASWAEGRDIDAAVARALAAATLSVTRRGTMDAMPTAQELDRQSLPAHARQSSQGTSTFAKPI